MKIEPTHMIPAELLDEYRTRTAGCLKNRIFAFCVSTTVLFMAVIIAGFYLTPELPTMHRMKMFLVLASGSGAVLFFNRQAECGKCLIRSKLHALAYVLLLLTVVHVSAGNLPQGFSYAHYLLLLFFATVMMPWSLLETVFVIAIHYAAFTIYFLSRDLSTMAFPPTVFGDDPFVNGFAHMAIASVMCLIIRYKDNSRDVQSFLLFKDIQKRKDQMEKELEFASRVHQTLIPQSVSTKEADVAVTYHPVTAIGGDYAKFHFLSEDQMIFMICDVTGHGIPAALMVNRLHAEFNALVRTIKEPGRLLKALNAFIVKDFEGTAMYLSAFCGTLDFKRNKILYSNYGHPPQYVYQVQGGELLSLQSQTTILGIDDASETTIYQGEIDYHEGDRVVLFTDGVVEIRNPAGEEFGNERVQALIRHSSEMSITDFNRKFLEELTRFSEGRFRDDIFLLSIQAHAEQKAGAARS